MNSCETEADIKSKVKDTLKSYRRYKKILRAAEEELNTLRLDLLNPLKSVCVDITGVHGRDISNSTANCINELIEAETNYINEILNLAKSLKKIESLVELLPADSDEKTLIKQLYICCHSWQQVRSKLGYERTKCYEIWGNALEIIADKVKEKNIILWD